MVQAQSELERPLLPEFQQILLHRLPIISEYVLDEFRSIVLANGGTCENQRAEELLSCLKYVHLPAFSESVLQIPAICYAEFFFMVHSFSCTMEFHLRILQ